MNRLVKRFMEWLKSKFRRTHETFERMELHRAPSGPYSEPVRRAMPPATAVVRTSFADVAEPEFLGYSVLFAATGERTCIRCDTKINLGEYMRRVYHRGGRTQSVHSDCIPWAEALERIV